MTVINRKETLAAIEIVKPALGNNKQIPAQSYIWFDGEYAYAHNGGIGIKTKLEMPLECGVPGTLFMGLLEKSGAETLEFELADDTLSFKAGKSKVKLATLPIERKLWKYPDAPTQKPIATIKITKAFLAGLKSVLILKPSEKKWMECHAVCIYSFDKDMELYTTDRNSSLIVAPVAEAVSGAAKKLALPRELAEQIVSKSPPNSLLSLYSDHFKATAGDSTTMYSNVFNTADMMDLPAYADRHINTKTVPPFKVPDGFNAALERASLLAGAEPKMVKLVISGKALKLSGRYKAGQLDEDFVLSKSIPKASIDVDAGIILGVKNVTEIAASDTALNLFGGDDFTYVLSGKAPVTKTAKRPSKVDEEEDA